MEKIVPAPPGDPRRPLGPRDPGDAWVEGDRGRFWGRFGSAGLLAHDPGKGILPQHRALWSDHGGTWGLPGGRSTKARIPSPARCAKPLRKPLPGGKRQGPVYFRFRRRLLVLHHGRRPGRGAFEPAITDPESIELRWIPLGNVARLNLHPAFAASWPALQRQLLDRRTGRGLMIDSGRFRILLEEERARKLALLPALSSRHRLGQRGPAELKCGR